ncbi:protein neprosin isoform X2 [Quercus suber]|uniref:protein neprosin isoform X2 n=1 Tax=Quercus suber TaxID=58331 RepID=UPI0032E001C6
MAPPCGSGRRWSRAVKMTFYLFFLIPMSSAGNRNTNTIFGKKQKLEVQQQLKRLNKPALKSIESPDGDIIDCVDIYKQPAFDHPLLKNHTIQPWHLNGRCPEGTIPIRRTKEEDLLRAGSVANFGRKKYHTIPHAQNNDVPTDHEYATLTDAGAGKYYGMAAEMNVWNPHSQEENEFSVSQFWVANGEYGQDLDTIEAGMIVCEDLYEIKKLESSYIGLMMDIKAQVATI